MKRTLPVLIVALSFVGGHVFSQTDNPSSVPNSLSPGSTATKVVAPKKKKPRSGLFSPNRDQVFREKKSNVKHTARYEFYERVEKAAKEKQRILRKLAKPQYSDQRYFGHKKLPKKRPPHKMRYCGECSIRH
jgi:hypothetical protein